MSCFTIEDYVDVPVLYDELVELIRLSDIYRADKSTYNRFIMFKHCEDLFFTIKAREVEGFINSLDYSALLNYLEVTLSD